MIPISDENPTLRTPVMTILLLVVTIGVWVIFQGAGFDAIRLATSICDYGLVPGEISGRAPLGLSVPIGENLVCVVDNLAVNRVTPLTSMLLHASWGHVLGNALFLWVFGNNVEDGMGRGRFLWFYVLCGLVAAATQVAIDPGSPVPMVGASGAISGVLGGYLVMYPHVRVRVLIPIIILPWIVTVRAWVVLIMWFIWQVIGGLPQLMQLNPEVSGGVAVWAHVGGFVAGLVLVRLFRNPDLVRRHVTPVHGVVVDPWAGR